MKQMTPAITNKAPNRAHSQRHESATAASFNCCAPANMNIRPAMIPMVVTDAWSNCSTTRAATIHATPTTSQSHEKRVTSRRGLRLRHSDSRTHARGGVEPA